MSKGRETGVTVKMEGAEVVKTGSARVQWVGTSVRGSFVTKDSSKRERIGLQDGSETCYDV